MTNTIEHPDQASGPTAAFIIRTDDMSVWGEAKLTEYLLQRGSVRQKPGNRLASALQTLEVEVQCTGDMGFGEAFSLALVDDQKVFLIQYAC